MTRRLTVRHSAGLHARASGAIVKTVSAFHAQVLIHYGNQQADAGGIFDIMMLCVPRGADVIFERKDQMPSRHWMRSRSSLPPTLDFWTVDPVGPENATGGCADEGP